jgi:RimJ/RimL family protein N-acetyltransferase
MPEPEPRLRLTSATLRPWRQDDAEALVRHANDRKVWINLRDLFPHPYTAADAASWLAFVEPMRPVRFFAIEVADEAAGGIGIAPQQDVHRRSGEIGYWLGRRHWNRGIMTEAVAAVTEHAFVELDLVRVHTSVFAWNSASIRVLEKCGYEREGLQRSAAFKDGRFVDCVLLAKLRA